jgi:hypothetical protein
MSAILKLRGGEGSLDVVKQELNSLKTSCDNKDVEVKINTNRIVWRPVAIGLGGEEAELYKVSIMLFSS